MKKLSGIIKIILAAAFIFVIIPITYINISSHRSYVSVLKIPEVWKLKAVKQSWGEPVDIITEAKNGSYKLVKLDYDGFYVTADKTEYDRHQDDVIVNAFAVYSDKFKFANKKIGVGSPKEDIVDLYSGKYTEISGLDSNECGYIIGRCWVDFVFDNNDIVEKIFITDGI
ncbi:MAG: hypothetical protein LUC92_09735 [Clostridiales bacterium]|nr:hypothetical protein [Clostridiales bacterium]